MRLVCLTTYNRANVLRVTLPRLRESVKRADAELWSFDSGSTETGVLGDLMQAGPVYQVYMVNPQNRRSIMSIRRGMATAAVTAARAGVEWYLHCDADALVGQDFVRRAFEAAAHAPENTGVLVFLSGWQYRLERDGEGGGFWYCGHKRHNRRFFDCTRMVRTGIVREALRTRGARFLLTGAERWCEAARKRMYLVRPQLEVQHLGYGRGATGYWHPFLSPNWWVRRPAVDAETGEVVQVGGFDLDAWTTATNAGPGAVEKFAATDSARRNSPVG